MLPRPRSAISLDALYLTPFLLTAILGALLSSGVLIALWLGRAGGPGDDANLIVAAGITGVAWTAVVFATTREKLLRRMEELGEQMARSNADMRQHITTAVAELTDHMKNTAADLVEQAEASGVFRGMDMEARRQTPERRLRAVPRSADRVPEARG